MTSRLLENVTFVVNSVDDERFLEFMENLRNVFASELPDVVRVPDARSMAEGLNRGARNARGEWLIFCHDDIRIVGDPRSALVEAMTTTDMFGPCGTVRLTSGNWYDAGQPYLFGHVIARDLTREGKFQLQIFGSSASKVQHKGQALDGIWIACRRSLFDALRGFDEATYTGFLGYDIDLSFRAALAGARIGIVTGLTLFHDSHVGEFSDEKIARWEAAQRNFENSFARHLSKEAGDRTHVNVPLESLHEAPEIIRQKQAQARVNPPPVPSSVDQLRRLGRALFSRAGA
jgi:hypothetical protein